MSKTDGDSDSAATLVADTEPSKLKASKPNASKLKASELEASKPKVSELEANNPEAKKLEDKKTEAKKLKKARQRKDRWQKARELKAREPGTVSLSLVLPPPHNGNRHSGALYPSVFPVYCNVCKLLATTPCETCELVGYCDEVCSKQPPPPEFMFPWRRVSR